MLARILAARGAPARCESSGRGPAPRPSHAKTEDAGAQLVSCREVLRTDPLSMEESVCGVGGGSGPSAQTVARGEHSVEALGSGAP